MPITSPWEGPDDSPESPLSGDDRWPVPEGPEETHLGTNIHSIIERLAGTFSHRRGKGYHAVYEVQDEYIHINEPLEMIFEHVYETPEVRSCPTSSKTKKQHGPKGKIRPPKAINFRPQTRPTEIGYRRIR